MANKVRVRPVGRRNRTAMLMDSRVAKHLVKRGRMEYVEDPESLMEAREKAVIERAPEPEPVQRVVKQEAGSGEPEARSSEPAETPEPDEPEQPEPEQPEPESEEPEGEEPEEETEGEEEVEEVGASGEEKPKSRRREPGTKRVTRRR